MSYTKSPGPTTSSTDNHALHFAHPTFHNGEITKGDLDVWTFTGNANERVAVEIGELMDTNGFFWSWIGLWLPDGTEVTSSFGQNEAQIADKLTINVTYLILVSSAYY